MTSGGPKDILVNNFETQSLKGSTYALFCLFTNMKNSRMTALDKIFNLSRLNVKDFSELEFGRVKAGMIPSGLILIFIRIHCEYQISDSLEKMVSNLKENVDPDFVLMNGEVKLRDREMENLSSVVLHRSFHSMQR